MQYNEEIQFFTTTVLAWKHLLKPDKYKDLIVESLRFLSIENGVDVFGFTIMPNHFHLIWTHGKLIVVRKKVTYSPTSKKVILGYALL